LSRKLADVAQGAIFFWLVRTGEMRAVAMWFSVFAACGGAGPLGVSGSTIKVLALASTVSMVPSMNPALPQKH